MTGLDIIVLIAIGGAAVLGAWRGFTTEVLAFLAWILVVVAIKFFHTPFTALLTGMVGTEIGAALTTLEPLGVDLLGLNCATGPAEMSEHLRHLSKYAAVGLACMPNAGLPQLTADGAHYPLTPTELAVAAYQQAREPKKLQFLPGGHFDAYVDGFDVSGPAARDWFVEHLGS